MPSSDTGVEGAVEVVAEILCAWDYRDDSGKTWPTLSDVGREGFRVQGAQLLEGSMPGREQSALDLIRRQERQRVMRALDPWLIHKLNCPGRYVGDCNCRLRSTLDSLEDPGA